jgi:hypothetical protein
MNRQQWQRPRVASLGELPEALGDCRGGQSESGECGCHNGGDTGIATNGSGVGAAMFDPGMHGCASGGIPSGCFCGERPSTFPI